MNFQVDWLDFFNNSNVMLHLMITVIFTKQINILYKMYVCVSRFS